MDLYTVFRLQWTLYTVFGHSDHFILFFGYSDLYTVFGYSEHFILFFGYSVNTLYSFLLYRQALLTKPFSSLENWSGLVRLLYITVACVYIFFCSFRCLRKSSTHSWQSSSCKWSARSWVMNDEGMTVQSGYENVQGVFCQ